MSAFIIGLTGGIGSGKSTVAEAFVAAGGGLVDTDEIAHRLTAAGGAAMPALRSAFGEKICDATGALDRAAMRHHVFSDPDARARLEGILHPQIRQLALAECARIDASYVVLAVPLLVESGAYRAQCDRILVVDCPESLQVQRVMARNGMTAAQVDAIMAAQASRGQRLAIADDVLLNDGDTDMIDLQVSRLHRKYLGLAAEKLKASC